MNLDFFLFEQINNWANRFGFLDFLGIFFAEYSGYLIIIFLLILLCRSFKKNWLLVSGALVSGILARLVITEIIRFFFYSPRPFVLDSANVLLEHSHSSSFPSGHASFYFAISFFVLLWFKKNRPSKTGSYLSALLIFLSFLIGMGRVFCGIHWVSDILAGFSVGFFSALFIFYIYEKFFSGGEKQEQQQQLLSPRM